MMVERRRRSKSRIEARPSGRAEARHIRIADVRCRQFMRAYIRRFAPALKIF